MTPTLAAKVTTSSEVLFQEVGSETVLLDLRGESYFGLNEMGTRMWYLIGEHKSLQTVFDLLLAEYDVEPDRLERDLTALVAQLLEARLLGLDSR